MQGADNSPESSRVLRQLAQLDRRARLAALLNGLGATALVLAAVVLLALLADFLWEMPLAVRISLLSAAGVAVVGGGLWAVARALWRRADPAAVAALVETTYPQLHERLSSIMEWSHQDAGAGSRALRDVVIREASRDLAQLNVTAPLPLARTTRRGAIGAAVLLGLLLPCLFFGGYRLLLERFATPWRNLERSSNLYFVVTPGDGTASRGSDVEIIAEPRWRVAQTQLDSATLRWRDDSGRRLERRMTWNAERKAFAATIDHVLQPFDYEIRAGRARSRSYHVDVVDRPALTSLSVTVEPPAYAGRAVLEIPGAVGDLELLRGGRLTLQLQFSLPVEQAALRWTPDSQPDGASLEPSEIPASLGEDRLSAEVRFSPESSGRFVLQLYDAIGLANPNDAYNRVIMVEDEPPLVRFTDRNPAQRARPHDVLRLPVSAVDDIGLAELELHYEVIGDDAQRGMVPASRPILGERAVQEEFEFDLSSLTLNEASIVAIRSRAADERPTPGPNEAWTRQRLITISNQADPLESDELSQQQQKLAQTLQRLRAAVADNRETTETLQSHAGKKAQANAAFDRDADLADLAAADRQTVAAAEQLAAMFELHPLLEALGARIRRVGHDLLTAAEYSTTEAQQAQSAEKPALLTSAHEQLLQAEEELAAVQRALEHLADLERDLLELQRLADDAKRLADDVEALKKSEADARESSNSESSDPLAELRAMAKDRLRDNHANLSGRLDDLLDRRPELLDSAAEHYLDHLAALREQAQVLAERERGLADALERESEPAQPDSGDDPPKDASNSTEFIPLNEIATAQSQLVERAIRMALDAAQAQSPAAGEIEGIARDALQASEKIESGDLSGAAAAALHTAQRAANAASIGIDPVDPEQAGLGALQQFADEQQAVASELAAASASPAARTDAHRQSQQRISDRTLQLEQQFADVARQLTADPLDRSADGERAGDSGNAAREARELMETSATSQSNQETNAAIEAARQAASRLDLAAEQARSAVENAPDSPVPTEVGRQVAQASQQLRKAGEQLGGDEGGEQSTASDESGDAQTSGEGDGQKTGQEGEGAMSEGDASDDGESSEGDASEGEMSEGDDQSELSKAAAALQEAAQRLKPRKPGERQAPSEGSDGQQPSDETGTDEPTDGSGTTETVRLTQLAEQLNARAMRNWGELPGELQSELQQRSQGRPDSDYAPLIRMYFNEISRRQSPSLEPDPE